MAMKKKAWAAPTVVEIADRMQPGAGSRPRPSFEGPDMTPGGLDVTYYAQS